MVVWEYGVLRCWHLLHIWLQLHPHSCSSNPTAFGFDQSVASTKTLWTGLANSPKLSQLSSAQFMRSEQALRARSTATVRAIGTVCIVCIVD